MIYNTLHTSARHCNSSLTLHTGCSRDCTCALLNMICTLVQYFTLVQHILHTLDILHTWAILHTCATHFAHTGHFAHLCNTSQLCNTGHFALLHNTFCTLQLLPSIIRGLCGHCTALLCCALKELENIQPVPHRHHLRHHLPHHH